MALIIEDGSQVAGANSYISCDDARAYCAARGRVLPAKTGDDDSACELLLTRALDYIEAMRAEFQGEKVSATQALQWPRQDVTVDGYDVDPTTVPALVGQAQAQLAYDASKQELAPIGDGREVTKEEVAGAVTIEYARWGNTNVQPIFNVARALLAPLLKSEGALLSSVRM